MTDFVVGGVPMTSPLILGGGAAKTPEATEAYVQEGPTHGAAESGGYTPEPREVLKGTVFYPPELGDFLRLRFGLNAFGLNNPGYEEAYRKLQALYALPHKTKLKPLVANISPLSVQGFAQGAELFGQADSCVAAITANTGCPNTENIPMAYDLGALRKILEAMSGVPCHRPVWLKLSPYTTLNRLTEIAERNAHLGLDFKAVMTAPRSHLRHVIELVGRYPIVRAVIFSNTLGGVVCRDASGQPVTTPNGGRAGLSGEIVKEISLDLIREAAPIMPEGVDLIGCGGVVHGDDAVDYFEAGAKAVQCTSGPFWYGGPKFFQDLLEGSPRLQNYLAKCMNISESQPQH